MLNLPHMWIFVEFWAWKCTPWEPKHVSSMVFRFCKKRQTTTQRNHYFAWYYHWPTCDWVISVENWTQGSKDQVESSIRFNGSYKLVKLAVNAENWKMDKIHITVTQPIFVFVVRIVLWELGLAKHLKKENMRRVFNVKLFGSGLLV